MSEFCRTCYGIDLGCIGCAVAPLEARIQSLEESLATERDCNASLTSQLLTLSTGSPIGSLVTVDALERSHLAALLQKFKHQGRVAKVAGVSTKTLYRKIRRYGLTARLTSPKEI